MRPLLIETLRVHADGRMPLLPWHLERLAASSQALDYRWSVDAVQRAIARHVAALPEGDEHRVRITVADNGQVRIETSLLPPLAPLPQVGLADQRLLSTEPWLRHKSTHRPWYAEASAWLSGQSALFDLVFLNERGEVCEGSRSNVYLRLEGRWWTPPTHCGVLPGAQRAALLDDEAVAERVLTRADWDHAEGWRLSNALRGWFDVQPVPTAHMPSSTSLAAASPMAAVTVTTEP
ncbi:MAG: aminotransferase class IV [Pigmentiphaga sp.]|nr:aminotransferase class IV [Pigmentiphaga sp.]